VLEDTTASIARLDGPSGLAFDAEGNLWFSESGSGRVRKLDPTGQITSLATGGFDQPRGMRSDSRGHLFLAESGGDRIIEITPEGDWWAVAGNNEKGHSGDGGPALSATLDSPSGLLVEPDGTILFADSGNGRIRSLHPKPVDKTDPIQQAPAHLLHAATLQEQALAPGQIAILMAERIGANAPGPIQVLFGETAAALLAVGTDRVTLQVPKATPPGMTKVTVLRGDQTFATTTSEVAVSAPGILVEPGGQSLALNQDGSLNSSEHPAARGSIVSLFLTGEGLSPEFVQAEIAGLAGEVAYAGPAPGLAGVFQMNVKIPEAMPGPGRHALRVVINGAASQDGVVLEAQ
jgi:uncharacterized protein (TIGR03437 family)